LGPPLVWTLPSGVIAYGGLFGDITIVENLVKSIIERD
jgi:hypothetical protein